jgi:hypothetical protein
MIFFYWIVLTQSQASFYHKVAATTTRKYEWKHHRHYSFPYMIDAFRNSEIT